MRTRDRTRISNKVLFESPVLRDAVVPGVTCRLGAVGDAGLVEDVADVSAHGVQADNQLIGDLLVGAPGGKETEYLSFAVGQTLVRCT